MGYPVNKRTTGEIRATPELEMTSALCSAASLPDATPSVCRSNSARTLDAITTDTAVDEHGDVESFESFYAGAPVYAYNVTARDGQGRILEMIETFGSESHTKGYRYDELGRLWQVLDDGVVAPPIRMTITGIDFPACTTSKTASRASVGAAT